MPLITVLRGFKISVAALDAFLVANGRDETFGHPPLPKQDADLSAFLRAKMDAGGNKGKDKGQGDACIVIPQREAYSLTSIAYVAYSWIHVFAQRQLQLDEELNEQVTAPFEQLRYEILSYSIEDESSKPKDFGKMGLFVVYTGSRNWTPEELYQRVQSPIHCDQCGNTFSTFPERQEHRQDVHGSSEGGNTLPEA